MLLLLGALAWAQAPVPADGTPRGPAGRKVTDERLGGAFGLGLAVGAPSGLTGKLCFSELHGVQFSAGGDLGLVGDYALTADYVVHLRPFSAEDGYSVPLHVGAGFNLSGNTAWAPGTFLMGPRAVFGASVLVEDLPLEFFVESAPTFYVWETLSWSFDGQIGTRWFF